jgi:hypothetical protein
MGALSLWDQSSLALLLNKQFVTVRKPVLAGCGLLSRRSEAGERANGEGAARQLLLLADMNQARPESATLEPSGVRSASMSVGGQCGSMAKPETKVGKDPQSLRYKALNSIT